MENENTEKQPFKVGLLVRAPLYYDESEGNSEISRKGKGRGMIALIDNSSISIIWDEYTFVPRSNSHILLEKYKNLLKRGISFLKHDGLFLIAPIVESNFRNEIVQDEVILPVSHVAQLDLVETNFEKIEEQESDLLSCANKRKETGDKLFLLHDYAAAIEQYELALALTSTFSIGRVIFFHRLIPSKKRSGVGKDTIQIAEIDCIDGDDIDITTKINAEEFTIKKKDILLCHLETSDFFQERLLLNISKSLLNAGETISEKVQNASSISQEFFKSAILSTSFITLISSQTETENISIQVKALYIRSKAYFLLRKYQNATIDLKKILILDPTFKEAKNFMKQIQVKLQEIKQVNKRLAKDMCRWVNKVTTVNDSNKLVREQVNNENHFHWTYPTLDLDSKQPMTLFENFYFMLSVFLTLLLGLAIIFFY